MLKLATENDLQDILIFCRDDLVGTRIACYHLSYGFERDFLSSWIIRADGEIKGVISLFYDSVTVKSQNAFCPEIREFLSMLCFRSLMCEKSTALSLGYEQFSARQSYFFSGDACGYSAEEIGEEHYKKAYELISRAIPDSFEDSQQAYLSFLSDFTFKKTRGFASGYVITEEDRLLACCVTSAETDSCAILSGVACLPESRKSGLGKAVVLAAVSKLKKRNKKAFVIALNDSAKGFYEHIGFNKSYEIAFINN